MNLDEAKALEPMTETDLQAANKYINDLVERHDEEAAWFCRFEPDTIKRLLALAAAHPVLVEAYKQEKYNAHANQIGADYERQRAEAAESRAAALEAQVAALREAAQTLSTKLALIHADARYQGVWMLYHGHGMKYDGPTYERELKALDASLALAAVPVQPKEDA